MATTSRRKLRTKIEGNRTGRHYWVDEVYVNSGRRKRRVIDAWADSDESAKAQLEGVMESEMLKLNQ